MDLKELGSRLREERQRQGLTMEQIMEITKISRVNIVAIESGSHKDFPHPVYAKGFVKNYAKALGFDSKEMGEEFSKLLESSRDDIFQTDSPIQTEYSDTRKNKSFGVIILIVVLLGIVGGLVYYLHDSSLLSFGQKDQAEISETVEVVEAPVVKSVEETEKTTEDVQSDAVQTEAAEADTEALQEGDTTEAAVEPNVVAETPAEIVEKVVVITTKPGEGCWIEAVVDGSSKEFVIQEGDSLTLPYKESLKVKLGNAGGVDILSNGNPFEFDAPKGKVKTLEFPVVP